MALENFLVIFDVDGVLSDTGPVHFKSWKKLADEIGTNFTKEFFEQTFGQQSVPIVKRMVDFDISNEKAKKWGDLKEQYYRDMIRDNVKPLPGVISLIKNLKEKGFILAVGSSGPRENIELILNSLHIKESFDEILGAEDVENGKPSPDVFLNIARRLNLDPHNCLVIEDAPVGIEAAKRAGMKCIALTTTHRESELKKADLIASDLTEINITQILNLIK